MASGPDAVPHHDGLLIVRSRPGPGLAAEAFESWYLDRHFTDVLASDAVVAADLYHELDGTRMGEQGPAASTGEYLALYQVAGDPEPVTTALRARMLDHARDDGLPEGYEFLERVVYRRVGGTSA